jgi:hypothetical protein
MLHGLPRAARSRAVAVLLASVGEGVDLAALLEAREDLRRIGVLLNQSLRFLHGGPGSVGELVRRIEATLAMVDAVCAKGKASKQCVP